MERAEWLKRMRSMAEALYDQLSPQYWVTFGLSENETHRAYLQKFLERVAPGGGILSTGCGAGRYDGLLLDAGHPVVGIDQSAGMLAQARECFPQAHCEKMGLQEIAFHEAFDGVICMDAMEHVSPEDYPHILRKFQEALKPGVVLYFTMDQADPGELMEAYERAKAKGLRSYSVSWSTRSRRPTRRPKHRISQCTRNWRTRQCTIFIHRLTRRGNGSTRPAWRLRMKARAAGTTILWQGKRKNKC